MIEKILNRYNFLYINKEEETYYRAFDGSKSKIELTIASLTIALELEWSKEYELGGSDHLDIIIEDESFHETIAEMEHKIGQIGCSFRKRAQKQ